MTMHKSLTGAIRSIFVSTILLVATDAFAVDPRQSAPSFELPAELSSTVSLAQLKGKVVYLDFWASWCGPCRQSFPWMNEMHAKYGAKGLVVLAINVDATTADAKKFLSETPAKFEIAYDAKGVTPKAFGIRGMPTSYLIDRTGKVLSTHAGFNPAKKSEMEAAIKHALESD
jgi:cytochrome c biogenesis protein CcmG/thiol:disulfide interchange protein DsbE